MRALIIAFALAACTPAPENKAAETTQDAAATTTQAAPVGAPMATGLMGGVSTTASGDVAALTINRENLAFSNPDREETFTVATIFLGEVAPSTPIAAGGESFAAAAPYPTAERVELRRVDGASGSLCGPTPATHVALVHAEALTGLYLIVFSGAEAPGPEARASEACATYLYMVD